MTATTPVYGLPYPEDTDPASSIPEQIQGIAEAVEATFAALYGGTVPGGGWADFAWASGWASVNDQGRYTKVGSRLILDLYGIRSSSSFTSGGTVGTLPVGFRPSSPWVRPVTLNSGGTLSPALATINTNGTVTVSTSGSPGPAISIGAAFLLTTDVPTN